MGIGTIFIALFYIFLLKWFVKPLLYFSMILIFVIFFLLGLWSFKKREDYNPITQKRSYNYAIGGAFVAWGIGAIFMCFMMCCRRNIRLGASIMECASYFVTSNFRIIFLPVLVYLISIIFFAYWIITCVYLYGIGTPVYDANLPVAKITNSEHVTYIMWYFLFGFFWVVAFIICI